jgi:hypothetical protein
MSGLRVLVSSAGGVSPRRSGTVLIEEAKWIGRYFASCADEEIFPLVNVGSSTGAFRAVTQPHLDREIFSPLADRGGTVYHVDVKDAPGVDLVGDLEDEEFIARLRDELMPRSILVSNLLEHVRDPRRVADAVVSIAPAGALIIVSGPRSYPYHPDPIDTRFRPSVEEVHALFTGTRLLGGEIIAAPSWSAWGGRAGDRTAAAKYFARLAVPMYRPLSWRRRLDRLPYAVSGVSAYIALLVKMDRLAG